LKTKEKIGIVDVNVGLYVFNPPSHSINTSCCNVVKNNL